MKKLLAMLLTLMMALGVTTLSWADTLTESADGKYHISAAAELKEFATMVNNGNTFEGKTVVLDGDIDLADEEWTPIGNRKDDTKQFKGVFDGQNHTVKKMKITNCTDYGALFEAIKGAEVKNVTVEGAVAGKSVAGVVAQAGAGSKIINCVNKATVTGSEKAAGIVVKIEGDRVTVEGCRNEGAVTCTGTWAAGIVAFVESENFKVSACSNTGEIKASQAGGIIQGISHGESGTVTGCRNSGKVTATGTGYKAAGIVASCGNAGNKLTITDCENTGAIEGECASAIACGEEFKNDASAPNTNSGEIKATVSRIISESTAVLNGDMSINLTIHPYATVTINSGNYSGSIESKGSLTVAGGTFRNGGNFYSSGTLVINNGTFARGVSVQTGTATINDGDFKTDVSCAGEGKLTINGGKFAGEIHASDTSTVNINGGEFTFNTDTNEVIDIRTATATVTISNGVFAQENANRFCPNNKSGLTVTGGTFVSEAMVTALMGETINAPQATVVDGNETMIAVGSAAIADAANSGKKVTITKGGEINGVNENVTVTVGADGVKINGKDAARGEYTVPVTPDPTPEQPPRYYYNSTTTTTKDGSKTSPKTFDAGVGIYAVTAVLSVTGMAWTAKKRH